MWTPAMSCAKTAQLIQMQLHGSRERVS